MGRNNVEKQNKYFTATVFCNNFNDFYQEII